jgi:hypothetical protein
MNDLVKTLMKRSMSAARKYKTLERQHIQLIDQCQRIDWTDPLRNQLERKREAIVAEMADLSGGL